MATLEVGNAVVGYSVEGSVESGADVPGAPMLLFHGTTQNRTGWDMPRAAMLAGRRYVLVEFPGAGESSMPTAPIETDDLVHQALAVMDHLGHPRFHVAGYSLGAVAALGLAAAAPDRVVSVTSLCGWATTDARMKFTFGLWRKLLATDHALFMRYAVADGFTAGAIAGLQPMLEDIVALGALAVQPGSDAQLDLDERVDIAPLLSKITSPALIIGGLEDRWVGIEHSRQLAAAIPGARLVELPAGHLVIQELAPEVATLIDALVLDTE